MEMIPIYFYAFTHPIIHLALAIWGIVLIYQLAAKRKAPPNAKVFLAILLVVIIIDMNLFGQSWLRSKLNSNQTTVVKQVALSYASQAISGTPEFAMREIARAVQEQNGELFLQYVDVDGILADVTKKIPGIQPARVKQQIMEEITSGKAKLPVQNSGPVMILFDDWIVGGVPADNSFFAAIKTQVLSLGVLDPRGVNDIAWVRVKVDSKHTLNRWTGGDRVRFKLIKEGGEYRVLADDQTTAGLIERYKAYVAAPQK